jgi:hypothetical protein
MVAGSAPFHEVFSKQSPRHLVQRDISLRPLASRHTLSNKTKCLRAFKIPWEYVIWRFWSIGVKTLGGRLTMPEKTRKDVKNKNVRETRKSAEAHKIQNKGEL